MTTSTISDTPDITNPARGTSFVRRPGVVERAAAIAALFVFSFSLPTDWFVRATTDSAGTVQGGSAITQLVFLGFAGIATLALMGNWQLFIAAMKREPLLPALIGLAMVSTVWSVNVAETFTTGIVMSISILVGYQLVIRFRLDEILLFTGVALGAGLFINYAFIFVFQDFGLDTINVGTDGGSKWSGVFVTKNELGRIAALSALVFGFLARIRRSILIWPLLTFLAIVQVAASDSATSLGALGGVLVLLVVFLGFRGRKTLYGATAIGMLTVFSTLTLLAATDLATSTGLLGKDATFTGRLPLWVNSFRYGVVEHRWLGYGWNAFWTDPVSRFDVAVRSNFDVPHAHNAFVDAWLFVGPLGAAVLLAIFVRGLVWGARNIRAEKTTIGLFPIVLISYSFIFSLTEAGVIRRDISLVLFTIAITLAAGNKGQRRSFVVPSALHAEPLDLHHG